MQTTLPNVFALKNSGFNAFLYADVGAELNGSALTILSMIARLDQDPWAEAARWATLPRAGAIESLAQSIAQMPLVPSALAETRVTAARLVKLLPAATKGAWQGVAAKAEATSVPGWLPVTILYFVIAFGMAMSALVMPKPPQAVPTPTEQSVAVAHAAVAAPLVRDEPVTGQKVPPPGLRTR
jgi:hypothetical protein